MYDIHINIWKIKNAVLAILGLTNEILLRLCSQRIADIR